MSRQVIIVDSDDNIIGSDELKIAKHLGYITRVSRVFLFNSKGLLYLQKRGPEVDFAGLWDQSAGGHVDAGENYLQAARRELAEEIGIRDASFRRVTKYFTDWEYAPRQLKRFNTVYEAHSDADPVVDGVEVATGKWVSLEELEQMMIVDEKLFPQGFIQAYQLFREEKRAQDGV